MKADEVQDDVDTEEELAQDLEEQMERILREGSIKPTDVLQHNDVYSRKCVTIVVLGDIGRSPRMCYHALSLAQEGYYVHMIGYGESDIPKELRDNPSVWFSFIKEPPKFLQTIPRMIAYPLKVSWMMLVLSFAFFWMVVGHQFRPDFILLQNPPGIPALAMCWACSRCLWAKFIVDWHNYGYSIMALSLGNEHFLVKFGRWFENYFGAKADKHLCVTRAMKADLKQRLNIDAVILYDRAAETFHSIEVTEKTEFLKKLAKEYPSVSDVLEPLSEGLKPGILVSSTSWTEDEDFAILLSALTEYESASLANPKLYPKLLVFITGKGPQQEYYKGEILRLSFINVEIHLPWLEHEDYCKLLASADLGISLHYSSSGLDLPMKIVDMYGSGLPVCAVEFDCISELVKHNENGLIFKDSTELGKQIQNWFTVTPNINPDHAKFKENILAFQSIRWHENWKFHAEPLFSTES